MSSLAPHAERIARALLGDPNDRLSTKAELRWGSAGSLAVRIGSPKRGTWYSHEECVGGGMLDLIERQTGRKGAAAFDWLREQGIDIPKPESKGKSKLIVIKLGLRSDSPPELAERSKTDRVGVIWRLRRFPYLPTFYQVFDADRARAFIELGRDNAECCLDDVRTGSD